MKDLKTVERINIRLARAQLGNFGDCKALGDGLYEMRLDFGAGFRIYYKQVGNKLYFLLIGGDKATQQRDINKAKEMAALLVP